MDKVFVDSGGWIACINRKDRHHQKAVNYLKALRKDRVPLITSNFIQAETITWIRYNINHQTSLKVIKLWEKVEEMNELTTYRVSKEIDRKAREIFKKYSDHILSYTDCTSFAICKKHGIKKVFGFDSDFNTLGYLLAPYQVKEKNYKYEILGP